MFDNPFPPDYGGAIDVFYKLKALAAQGVKPVLHVFVYGRNKTVPLKMLASEIYVYERKRHWTALFSSFPFIVKTRMPLTLAERLKNAEIIMYEGIHTTGFADQLEDIPQFLRAHNYETAYYRMLFEAASPSLKRLYYASEHRILKKYEPVVIQRMDKIFSVSRLENELFKQWNDSAEWLPVFHPFDRVELSEETEEIVLFHGNLSVEENQRAVRFLWKEVLEQTAYPFVVAGKNPPSFMHAWNKRFDRFYLIPNPKEEKLRKLIARARVNVIWSEARTGIKLKLIHALFRGKNVIANANVTDGTCLANLVLPAGNPEEIRRQINEAFKNQTDLEAEQKRREEVLKELYNNEKNIKSLLHYV